MKKTFKDYLAETDIPPARMKLATKNREELQQEKVWNGEKQFGFRKPKEGYYDVLKRLKKDNIKEDVSGDDFSSFVKKFCPNVKLNVIGNVVDFQSAGSEALPFIIHAADECGVSLKTMIELDSSGAIVLLYKRYGFKIVDSDNLPANFNFKYGVLTEPASIILERNPNNA